MDVYGFGIVLTELFLQENAFSHITWTSHWDFVRRMTNNQIEPREVPENVCGKDIKIIVTRCISRAPDERPEFTWIAEKLRKARQE